MHFAPQCRSCSGKQGPTLRNNKNILVRTCEKAGNEGGKR